MVALEAMACGLPVVASRRPGFEALLGSGGGILVDDPAAVNELAAALIGLLDNRKLAEACGRKGYSVAREFTVERTTRQFVDAIETLR